MVSRLIFRSLTHFEVIFVYGVRKCPSLTNFPSIIKEIVFFLLYILAAFIKDQVSIGMWIYFWSFYFVPLMYISVFVPVPYCLDDCSFVV